MSLLDAFAAAFDALRLNRLRSALTMLGIVIGVASVIVMMAVGNGAREQLMQQIRSLGTNLFVLWAESATQAGVRLGAGAAPTLTYGDAVAIANEGLAVQVATPVIFGRVQIIANAANWATAATGVDLGWFEARDWDVEQGSLFDPQEVRYGTQVALLGQTVARKLFGDSDPVGLEVRVGNVPLRVVGVMAGKGNSTTGQDQDDVIFLPLNTARQRVLGRNQANAKAVNLIFVKVRDGESMIDAEEDVRSLLRHRHRLGPEQADDFTIRNIADVNAAREASAHTLKVLLSMIAGVSLVVGGIGIMNIMLASTAERTREIGLRLAVGARPRDILSQFLIEAVGLSLIGGLVGTVVGVMVAFAVAVGAEWPLIIKLEAVVLAVMFSTVVGILFGWYPALRASRLDPIQALKHS